MRILLFSLAILLIPALVWAEDPPAAKDKPAEAPKRTAETSADPKKEEPKKEEPAPDSPAGKFAAANREWTALDKRLTELQDTYRKTDSAATRDEIKKQYTELVEQSNKLLPTLRAAAEAAYLAEPNKDPAVTRMLIGMVAYDYRRDDFEPAVKLAKLLADHDCTEEVLYAIGGEAAFQSDDYETAEKFLTRADKAGKLSGDGKQLLAELPDQKKLWAAEAKIREQEAAKNDLPRVKLETSKGPIVIELFENEAPKTVGNFVSLVESKFYDGLTFHRVLPGFMAQGGDPKGDGTSGPGYEIPCECDLPNARMHFRGTMSMAHAGKDTGGSQFFLTFRPTTHLNEKHTVFGRVIEGMDVLAKLQRRDPESPSATPPDKIVKAEVVRKRDHKYEPTKVGK
ncbi:MAG: peptidylprolyl isomerase [Pirellulaceae bacterium]|nr:peptidylprolyl isomerase [Pirellulaceae bacterium]